MILLFKNLLKCDEKGLTLNAISIETGRILRNCLDNFNLLISLLPFTAKQKTKIKRKIQK
jgi:hypothetical protein